MPFRAGPGQPLNHGQHVRSRRLMSCPAIPSPSPLQPQGAKEHPQDGIPQALSHGVMEVPLCSSFPLAAAGEHQLGCERGRGEGRRKRGTSARQRQGESWPLRCTCVLQMAGGCHWMVGDGTSLFPDPKLQQASAWGWVPWLKPGPTAQEKRRKKPSTCHMFP